ncbi:MAG: hypothetical protein AAF479_03950 [Pseudomonadota bacterium]
MNMLISELQMLASDWRSWIVVALMAFVATHSIVYYFMCPYAHGRASITDDAVQDAQSQNYRPGLRFGLMMIVGITLTLMGLFMIAEGIRPTLALVAMVGGIVIVQTEPTRSVIRENTIRLIANRDAEPIRQQASQMRLRGSHRELVTKNVILLTALVAGLLAFG